MERKKIVQLVPVSDTLAVYATPGTAGGYITDKCDFAAVYEDGTTGLVTLDECGFYESLDNIDNFIGVCRSKALIAFISRNMESIEQGVRKQQDQNDTEYECPNCSNCQWDSGVDNAYCLMTNKFVYLRGERTDDYFNCDGDCFKYEEAED